MPKSSLFISLFIYGCIFLFGLLLFPQLIYAQTDFSSNPNFDSSSSGVQIILVMPPSDFTKSLSATNITQVCSLGQALNIVLDDPNTNSITFPEEMVDLCSSNVVSNLNQYVQLDKLGEVTVRSDLLPTLNKPADVTMRNLPFDKEPDVTVDGQQTTNKDIENKIWDGSTKTLKFTAEHFSTYKAVAAVLVSSSSALVVSPKPEAVGNNSKATFYTFFDNSFWYSLIIAGVMVVMGVILMILMNSSKRENNFSGLSSEDKDDESIDNASNPKL